MSKPNRAFLDAVELVRSQVLGAYELHGTQPPLGVAF